MDEKLDAETIHSVLMRSAKHEVTILEVMSLKAHIAKQETTLEGIRSCLPEYRRGVDWVRCAESSIEVCNQLEEANRQHLPEWSPGDSPAEVVAFLVNQIEDWKSRWQAEDQGARAAREALQVERDQWRQEKERLEALLSEAQSLAHDSVMAEADRFIAARDGSGRTTSVSALLQSFLTAYGIQPEALSPTLREDLERLQSRLAGQERHLTPTGHVAEDVERVHHYIHRKAPADVDDALSRLSTQAQGYASLVAVCSEVSKIIGYTGAPAGLPAQVQSAMDLWSKTLAEYQHAERERLKAVADNASFMETLRLITEASISEEETQGLARAVYLKPHSGAALLEQHHKNEEEIGRLRRLLTEAQEQRSQIAKVAEWQEGRAAQARNEGLEEAAMFHDRAAQSIELALRGTTVQATIDRLKDELSTERGCAARIREMKSSASGSASEVTRYTAQARIAIGPGGKLRIRPVNIEPASVSDAKRLRFLGEEQGKRVALLEQVLTLASSTQSDGWHLNICRAERRGMPGDCVDLCAQLRATGRSGS